MGKKEEKMRRRRGEKRGEDGGRRLGGCPRGEGKRRREEVGMRSVAARV